MKIYAAIDLYKGQVVRLRQGKLEALKVYSSDPLQTAQLWQAQGADGLHIVDLEGAFEGKPKQLLILEKIAKCTHLPIQYGGGLRTENDVFKAIESGAQRVVIGSRLLSDPSFLEKISGAVGSERIVAAIDAKDGQILMEGWTKESRYRIETFVKILEKSGAGFLLYTNVMTDGTLEGPDIKGTQKLVQNSFLPVFASGGIGCLRDVEELQKIKGLYGAILGKSLYEKKISIHSIKNISALGSSF
ncbi:1-(5-phosphoribosyl)-5-((5-phosphoribosylamino)methylideneamino)imidazole-4-carboxamide isomerase [Methylacidiphilum sp. Yel]|jgi:phosphoribosylformimino-5-aminoimidazole carboxamide ribotide isomerase|uniref:1-(5-phosphoribosyl)-5-[(5- phosphoribosylamino)methylideneamino]imidazole-4- carboxamide isomerase n=1 Tax=Methylacidiphilum sp. Yel TaxID=1847730 RepID=UPI00106A789B|nr:1-(5-phosphoribosyl)-5-[(5-phosphoribosylamino)methylideneamino] imidazole-4-carboxamide isomerase [Methylacidiphilum sp. Yel]TFE69057.1 1-(5-phosphoribosyl)-5-((5-phosphoribosylamino)methylideneamino)imidazole-4-carboxamide isomerase [Methylacidiphilum sp. Yel]